MVGLSIPAQSHPLAPGLRFGRLQPTLVYQLAPQFPGPKKKSWDLLQSKPSSIQRGPLRPRPSGSTPRAPGKSWSMAFQRPCDTSGWGQVGSLGRRKNDKNPTEGEPPFPNKSLPMVSHKVLAKATRAGFLRNAWQYQVPSQDVAHAQTSLELSTRLLAGCYQKLSQPKGPRPPSKC